MPHDSASRIDRSPSKRQRRSAKLEASRLHLAVPWILLSTAILLPQRQPREIAGRKYIDQRNLRCRVHGGNESDPALWLSNGCDEACPVLPEQLSQIDQPAVSSRSLRPDEL